MNHDYSHCIDYTNDCPKECFRAQLVRDLQKHPDNVPNGITWSALGGTEDCIRKENR